MMVWYNPATWFRMGDKAADAAVGVIDGVKSGLDMLILTDEEKIQYSKDGAKLHLEFLKLNMDQNSERSKARREIAKAVVYFQLFMSTVMGVAYWYDDKFAAFLLKINVEMKIALAFVSIIFFYFGYYGLQKVAEKVKGK